MSTGTISAALVRHPRRHWECDSCGAPMGMAPVSGYEEPPLEPALRAAVRGDAATEEEL